MLPKSSMCSLMTVVETVLAIETTDATTGVTEECQSHSHSLLQLLEPPKDVSKRREGHKCLLSFCFPVALPASPMLPESAQKQDGKEVWKSSFQGPVLSDKSSKASFMDI